MSFLCALPLASSLLAACTPPAPFATGYVEGEFVLVAPVAVAQIRHVAVSRGDRIEKGGLLVEMERRDTEIAIAEATAGLAQARAHLADLKEGKRAEEIEVIEANLASAGAQASEATRIRERISSLTERGAATTSQQEDAITAEQVALARVRQIEAELAVARLPARPEAISQAEAAVRAAEAALSRANWNHEQRTLTLAESVIVYDLIRGEGEIAGPNAPILSVLGEGAVKLRLYVPETSISRLAVGDLLDVSCDGCADGLSARVTYIADGPEFTPPVIYSLENRQKLVYLVEARPESGGALKPGQIVDVALPDAE
ncbi:MAG: HlyD family efflux transporter periplasmic adaptor subunit [Silicimonas sp.]|nr:HlyD family efflux transporter periplasmic adaptor subunit [Silicimonas sp.]